MLGVVRHARERLGIDVFEDDLRFVQRWGVGDVVEQRRRPLVAAAADDHDLRRHASSSVLTRPAFDLEPERQADRLLRLLDEVRDQPRGAGDQDDAACARRWQPEVDERGAAGTRAVDRQVPAACAARSRRRSSRAAGGADRAVPPPRRSRRDEGCAGRRLCAPDDRAPGRVARPRGARRPRLSAMRVELRVVGIGGRPLGLQRVEHELRGVARGTEEHAPRAEQSRGDRALNRFGRAGVRQPRRERARA